MAAVVAGQGGGAVLDGVLERVTFANPETGYTIARIAPERGGADLITAVGPLLGAQIGEFLCLRGRWSSHPRYGRQFEVHSYATVLPATAAGIQKYLGSGLIKGIGPVMAERMVTHFGVDIMHVIENEPGRLAEVAVLTGGPGCGKSFTVRSVVELARAKGATIVLAAPTGRAAKRLAELVGHEAATIHRLLQLRPGGDPSFDADKPLDADLVVVDETSMVDVILANKLVKAVPPGAHLLLVGDVDQLPSVGAGEVLRDLLAAGSLPAVRLTKIFRQAQQSGIVINAHRINAGQQPQLNGFGDFFWFGCEDTEQTAGLVVDIVARRIPAWFGLDPRRDIQVLCPMHRGPAGAGNLNQLLQEALTPSREGAPERRYGGRVFRVGDKVTQLRNNYDKGTAGVFNGTVGVVTTMSPEEHTLTVRTDEDEQVDYGFDELDELAHAYAVTIHRSQGSEYPAVVIPLVTSSWMMLQRNLLYTGVTRAKKLVVLAGSRRALAAAIRTRPASRRHTVLAHRLHPHPSPTIDPAQHQSGR